MLLRLPGLAAVAALRRLLEDLEALHVRNARAKGWSWEAIAAALGVTRQSAHKRHARRLDEVWRRAGLATSIDLDDPSLWQLRRSRLRPLRVEVVGPASRLPLDGLGRKVIEVAMHYAHRRHALVTGEDLLVGLLADGSNESVRILCHLRVDLGQLWVQLRGWQRAA